MIRARVPRVRPCRNSSPSFFPATSAESHAAWAASASQQTRMADKVRYACRHPVPAKTLVPPNRTPSRILSGPELHMRPPTLLLAFALATTSVTVLPTATADSCQTHATYCMTCPGPGYHDDCQSCYTSSRPDEGYCVTQYGCETECHTGPCAPGETQGDVWDCRCDEDYVCNWNQKCDDADGDLECDVRGTGGEGPPPACPSGSFCFSNDDVQKLLADLGPP